MKRKVSKNYGKVKVNMNADTNIDDLHSYKHIESLRPLKIKHNLSIFYAFLSRDYYNPRRVQFIQIYKDTHNIEH